MANDYYSFKEVLEQLQMEEDDLKKLVSEGEIRAFRAEDTMKFRKSDIDGLKKGKMTEPTIILPAGEEESSEDSEVLLVEQDTSETLFNIDDDDLDQSDSDSTELPGIDTSSHDAGPGSDTITEELTFEDDSQSYELVSDLDTSDEMLHDSSEEITPVGDTSEDDENFIDSDTGLITEPMQLEESVDSLELVSSNEEISEESELTEPIISDDDQDIIDIDEDSQESVRHTEQESGGYIIHEEPIDPTFLGILIATTLILLLSGMFVINIIREVDTPATGWLTDIAFKNIPAKYLYVDGQVSDSMVAKHIRERQNWRK